MIDLRAAVQGFIVAFTVAVLIAGYFSSPATPKPMRVHDPLVVGDI